MHSKCRNSNHRDFQRTNNTRDHRGTQATNWIAFMATTSARPDVQLNWYLTIKEASSQTPITVQNAWPGSLAGERFSQMVPIYGEQFNCLEWFFQPRITNTLTSVADVAALSKWPANVRSMVVNSEVKEHLRETVPNHIMMAFPVCGLG